METTNKHSKKSRFMWYITTLMLIASITISNESNALPYIFKNNSTYSLSEMYVCIVGKQNDQDVWVDCKTGTIYPMYPSYNTITGPSYGGNKGPGGNSQYADCFSKVSDIPNQTINLGYIEGCRMFISFKSPLYFYFFGPSGAVRGYAGPNLSNPTDPNQGIRYEIIELTNGANGLWVNTTRVDTYQYPMGLEVWGANNYYKKVGELLKHQQIISLWKASAPAAFQSCLDANLEIIHAPSKISAFQPAGAQANYFKPYIDAIWSKYSSEDLIFGVGNEGVWHGRVNGNQFVFTRPSDGATASIAQRPTNIEVLEGSGVMAAGGRLDKVLQAQICAAINRHAIDLTISGVQQDFSNENLYYQTPEYNWYSKFWHQPTLSFGKLTYAFCYDDVFDKSSTVNCSSPTKVQITVGGFAVDRAPYKAQSIPGVIEAEDYDIGGQTIAYNDATAGNSGTKYRNDDVDIETCTDLSGAYNVGYIENGEWLEYTLEKATSGLYDINIRVASNDATTTKSIDFYLNNKKIASANINNTGGWQTWQSVSIKNVQISGATNAVLRPSFVGGQFNLNLMEFVLKTKTQNIALNKGWNLISTNVSVADSSIASLFNGLDVQEIKDMNQFWRKGQTDEFNGLKTITSGAGYLVNMNAEGTLSLTGVSASSNFQIPTFSNWYLIGCASQTAIPFSTDFNASNCIAIKNFEGFWKPVGTTNSIENREPGKGYFYKAQ